MGREGSSREGPHIYPVAGEDPREIDRELTDAEEQARIARTRHVTNPQEPERQQGTSADAPGQDWSDRERAT